MALPKKHTIMLVLVGWLLALFLPPTVVTSRLKK